MRYFLPIFILVFSFQITLKATEEYAVEQFQVALDLPVSEISEIFMGSHGMIWVGTNNGLYYFDGYNFKKISSPTDAKTTLDRNVVFDISQDFSDRIWLLTEYGLEYLFIQESVRHKKLRLNNYDEIISILHSNYGNEIYLSSEKFILKLNTDSGLLDTLYLPEGKIQGNPVLMDNVICFFEDGELVQFNTLTQIAKYNSLDIIINQTTLKLVSFDSDYLYFTHGNRLYQFHREDNKLTLLLELPNAIIDFAINSANDVVLATPNKIFKANISRKNGKKKIELLKRIDAVNINNVLFDRNNLIWISTDRSILKLNPYSNVFKRSSFLKGRFNYPIDDFVVFDCNKNGLVFRDTKSKMFFYHNYLDQYYPLPDKEYSSVCLVDSEIVLGSASGVISYNIETHKIVNLSDNLYVNIIRNIDDQVWLGADQGLFFLQGDSLIQVCNKPVWDFIYKEETFYTTTEKGFGKLDLNTCEQQLIIESQNSKDNVSINDALTSLDGKTWIATNSGLYQFISKDIGDLSTQEFRQVHSGAVYALIESPDSPEVWYSSDLGLGAVNYRSNQKMIFGHEDGITPTPYLSAGALYEKNGEISFVTGKQKITFLPDQVYKNELVPQVFISNATLIGKKESTQFSFLSEDTLIVAPNVRLIEMELTTLDYFSPRNTVFTYSIESISSSPSWQTISTGNRLSIGGLVPGKYELLINTKNSHGLNSIKPRRLILLVQAPVLQTKLAIVVYIVTLVLTVIILIRVRTRTLRKINREYKEKELIARKIEVQKEELTYKNKNITDSINYARRIQLAMMPSVKLFSSIFPDSFVLHMPKDIVSGDFYWVNHVKDQVFFSAVDCTGHGVPGAFMSIIGVELFRRITEIEGIDTPAEVLNSLSRNFDRVFGDVDEMKLRDGMDLAFCTLNEDHTVLQYSGAFNPLYIIRDSSILEYKADRHSVGVYEDDDQVRSFNNHVIPVKDGDTIYIFTDGFADQFGGPEGKKYKYRRFRHLLLALHQLPMAKQSEFLRKSILEWKGELDQVDDILVMGLKIHSLKK